MKRSLFGTPVAVEAGDTFRAKAKRGFRVVTGLSVRGLKDHFPFAIVREVLPSGALAYGKSRMGLSRVASFVVTLTRVDGVLTLAGYERVSEATTEMRP